MDGKTTATISIGAGMLCVLALLRKTPWDIVYSGGQVIASGIYLAIAAVAIAFGILAIIKKWNKSGIIGILLGLIAIWRTILVFT